MSALRSDIKRWLESAKNQGATHLIVACDTWDLENYPVYVTPGQSVGSTYVGIMASSMQTVDEVYSLVSETPLENQLKEIRSWHFEPEQDPRK